MSKELRNQLRTSCLLCRFRCTDPTVKSRRYFSYKTIAATLGLTCYEVEHICQSALLTKKELSFD